MLLPENYNTKPGRQREFSHTAMHRASTGHFLFVPVQLQEFWIPSQIKGDFQLNFKIIIC